MTDSSGVRVEEVLSVDDALMAAMVALVPQLSRSAPPPTAAELQAIVDSPATVLFAAFDDDGSIIGSLTLALFRVPTGMRAWIEDVVVDTNIRGKGVGAALTEAAIARAGEHGARTVDLTSRPSRESANRLYQRLGFAARNTNVYRWSSESED
jgi:ribosomal protein S18 acetylase RimI-like enzyme